MPQWCYLSAMFKWLLVVFADYERFGSSFDQARATDLELLMRSVVDSGHGWHLCTPEIKCIMSTYVGQVYEGPISLSVTNMPSFSRCVIDLAFA